MLCKTVFYDIESNQFFVTFTVYLGTRSYHLRFNGDPWAEDLWTIREPSVKGLSILVATLASAFTSTAKSRS